MSQRGATITLCSIFDGHFGFDNNSLQHSHASLIHSLSELLAAERLRENEWLKNILGFVAAAAVGVLLNFTIYLNKAVFFGDAFSSPSYQASTLTLLTFAAMCFF